MFTNYSQLNMLGMGSSLGYQNFLGGSLDMSGFGMGSIFGTGFGGCNMFQSCDGTINYDAMAGMAVGGFLLNLAGGIASNAIAQKQANKAESPTVTKENLLVDIEAQRKVVANKQDNVIAAQKAFDTVNTDIKTITSDIKTLGSELDALKKDSAYIANVDKLKELNNKIGTAGVDQVQLKASIELVEAKIADHEKKIGAKQAEITAKNSELTAKQQLVAASGETAVALNNAKEELNVEKNKLDALNTKLHQIQGDINEQILDKADGHGWQQTKLDDLKAKFDSNGNFQGEKVSKADIRRAIQMYRNSADSPKEQKEWTEKFNKLWTAYINQGDDPGNDLKAARKLIPNA